MKFPFPFKSTDISITTTAAASWPWPRCGTNPRTLSFRAESDNEAELVPNPPESAVISGLRSERLFFEPGATSSILEAGVKGEEGESTAVAVVAMESRNPFFDFRVSMEEMVEACGVRDDWEFLEELLEWYLRVNDESNYCYVVGAFVDLLVSAIDENASSSSSSSTSFSFTSPLSFSSSSTEDRYILRKNVDSLFQRN